MLWASVSLTFWSTLPSLALSHQDYREIIGSWGVSSDKCLWNMITCFQFSRFSLQNYYLSDLTIGWNVKFCPRSISSIANWAINNSRHLKTCHMTPSHTFLKSDMLHCVNSLEFRRLSRVDVHVVEGQNILNLHVSVLKCLRLSSG